MSSGSAKKVRKQTRLYQICIVIPAGAFAFPANVPACVTQRSGVISAFSANVPAGVTQRSGVTRQSA